MKGVDPARRAHAHPVDLRVHARLDRPRRGRPDAPADRAARDAARDAEHRRRAARRASTRPRSPGGSRCAQTDRPTVLALSRQGLPVWDPAGVPDDAIERGAYVLQRLRRRAGADPDGHRLRGPHRARGASKLLEAEGVQVRLVSMPCLDRFAEQDQAYRDSVLPPSRARARGGRGREPARLAPLGRRRRRRRRDGGLRRLRAGEGAVRALRLHGRGGRGSRPRGCWRRSDGVMSVTAGQRAPRRADRGRHERLAGPDPPRHDRERRARSGWSRRTRCAASPPTRRSSRRRSSARPTTTTSSQPLAREGLTRARGLPPPGGRATSSSPPTCCARSTTRRAATTATSRSRSRRGSRTTPRARSSRRASTGGSSTART